MRRNFTLIVIFCYMQITSEYHKFVMWCDEFGGTRRSRRVVSNVDTSCTKEDEFGASRGLKRVVLNVDTSCTKEELLSLKQDFFILK